MTTLSNVMQEKGLSIGQVMTKPIGVTLSFDQFRKANLKRCNTAFHPEGGINEWTPTDWACAMAGESGEACNVVKKLRRISETPEELTEELSEAMAYVEGIQSLADELADVIAYADLLAARFGIDLAVAVRSKFNAVSARVGSAVTL